MKDKTLYILVDDPTCYGGIQQFSRDLAACLSGSFRVVLLAYSGTLSHLKKCDAEIVRLNFAEKRSRLSRLFLGGAETYLHPGLRRNLALLADRSGIRRRLSEIMTGDDILLVNSFHSAHLFVPEKVLRDNRVCFVQHNSPEQLYKWRYDFGGFFRRAKLDLFNRYVDAMVMLSPFEEAEFAKYLKLSDKVVKFIRHRTAIPERPEMLKSANVMLIGRLCRQKRVDRLLLIAEQAPEFKFNIYGDGPDEVSLKRRAVGLKNVEFHGYLRDIGSAMRKNSVAIIVSDFEGYPISGIECVANGKPLVVLDSFPAARDLVSNGENGILLPEFSATAFADALRKVRDNYDSFHKAALVAREKYRSDIFEREWKEFIGRL